MAVTRAKACPVYGVGCKLPLTQLPRVKEVMEYYSHVQTKLPKTSTSNEVVSRVADKVMKLWSKASIPIVPKQSVQQKIQSLDRNLRTILKDKTKIDAVLHAANENLNLFDIATCHCPNFIRCNCPVESKLPEDEFKFLQDQRYERNMHIGSLIKETTYSAQKLLQGSCSSEFPSYMMTNQTAQALKEATDKLKRLNSVALKAKLVQQGHGSDLQDTHMYSDNLSRGERDKIYDVLLKRQGFRLFPDYDIVEEIPSDGNCLFTSLAVQLGRTNTSKSSQEVRKEIVNYMRSHPEIADGCELETKSQIFCNTQDSVFCDNGGFSRDYLDKMSRPGEWGDGIILCVAARKYKRNIIVLYESKQSIPIEVPENDVTNPITLGYIGKVGSSDQNHYISLRPAGASIDFNRFNDPNDIEDESSQQTQALGDIEDSQSEWDCEKNNIIDKLLSHLKDMPTSNNVEQWKDILRILRTQHEVKKMTIALDGDAGEGKSSLLNALLDIRQCTPTGDDGTSVTQTVVEISSSPNNKYVAIVEFHNEEEWKEKIEHYSLWAEEEKKRYEDDDKTDEIKTNLDESNKPEEEQTSTSSFIEQLQYFRLLSQFVERILARVNKTECKITNFDFTESLCITITCESVELLCDNVSKFVTENSECDEENICKFVKCVKMHIANVKLLNSVTFVDMPGRANSKQPVNKKADEYLSNCDAIWIVARISRCISGNAIDIVDESFSKKIRMEGRAGAISFICTRTDEVDLEKCLKNPNFIECQEKIKLLRNNNKKEVNDELRESIKELKENCSLQRNTEVKTKLEKLFFKKLNRHNDIFQVHCVSPTEYLKFREDAAEPSTVFTTVNSTGIPDLSSQLEKNCKEMTSDYKNHHLTKLCFIIQNIAETIQNPKGIARKERLETNSEDNLSVSNIINKHRDSFLVNIMTKYEDLEVHLDKATSNGIKDAGKICKNWDKYKWNTYYAIIRRQGSFKPTRRNIVDFNAELRDIFSDSMETKWSDFFHIDNSLYDFKSNVVQACRKSYSASCEMPIFVEPQLKKCINELIKYRNKTQQFMHQLLLKSIKDDMEPAYDAGKCNMCNMGAQKEVKNIIKAHVRDHKIAMFNKLNELTKQEMKKFIAMFKTEIEKCCSELIKDLNSMHLLHNGNVRKEAGKSEVCQKLRDVMTQLFHLDEQKIIRKELDKVNSILNEIQTDTHSSEEDIYCPSPKRAK